MSVQANLVHASDSLETAREEVARFFADSELYEYSSVATRLVYSDDELGS
jgi:nucleoside-diphosphate kinase